VHKKLEEGKGRIHHSLTSRQSSDKTAHDVVCKIQARKKERKQASRISSKGRIEKRRLSMMESMEMNLIQVQEEPCLLPLLPHLCSCFVESHNISFFLTPLSLLEYCSRDQT
jgi:hypothetical protein